MKFDNVDFPYNFKLYAKQGLTNDLLILNNKYFVKRTKNITKAFLNYQNQLNIINLIKFESFTLPILEAKINNNKLWTLMKNYQTLKTLSEVKLTKVILEQLANLVKKLHKVKINNKIETWDPLKQLNLYCNLITPKVNVTTFKNELENWLKDYQIKKIVLSHNDLIADNFVYYQEKWYLIDWDFACINDYLFDIASFISETLTKTEDIKYWYQLFKLSQEEIIIVQQWIKYQNLIWYHWALYLYYKTNKKIYQIIADKKITMLLMF